MTFKTLEGTDLSQHRAGHQTANECEERMKIAGSSNRTRWFGNSVGSKIGAISRPVGRYLWRRISSLELMHN
jgi:hypothetical protein